MQNKISLWGYMGAGKSSLGKELAKVLAYAFLDLDTEIEKQFGKISDIFTQRGEIGFRKLERQVLTEVLRNDAPLVLSTGGGTPVFYDNATQLNTYTQSVYLRASPPTLAKRLFPERENRPLIRHIKEEEVLVEFIAKHLFERNPFYSKAEFSVGVDDLERQEVLVRIREKVL